MDYICSSHQGNASVGEPLTPSPEKSASRTSEIPMELSFCSQLRLPERGSTGIATSPKEMRRALGSSSGLPDDLPVSLKTARNGPADCGHFLTNSTRLLLALPAGVSFLSTG